MAYATVGDVQARLGRPLTPEEEQLAATLLDDVEAMIRARIPNLDARVVANENYRALVVMVEANAVIRVLKNPEGYRQETEGNYSYSLNVAAAAGYLLVLDSEWALLGASRGAWTIAPVVRSGAGCPPDPWVPGRCWP
ncbi:Gp19/Gp15/Gp42 family protein [Marinitenerispora sediminis]|uniref:Phage protein Gp19/Gp15/Gp42 n=1 Tax=Marinitenerispora sediminis TaxID=1931232 RepID=A0A368T6N6_9ACTN|nr:Gp19/Gp15/Gp42 family protein [Marinitenerispora sediminis]RCV53474.1 hypothetical protein DEF23_17495 [Marinitenerispora sediminis]RCV59302.1 hypothetical protein DEF24_10035 [Marinitenerispora sediminis]